jgi:hypothetical protein
VAPVSSSGLVGSTPTDHPKEKVMNWKCHKCGKTISEDMGTEIKTVKGSTSIYEMECETCYKKKSKKGH